MCWLRGHRPPGFCGDSGPQFLQLPSHPHFRLRSSRDVAWAGIPAPEHRSSWFFRKETLEGAESAAASGLEPGRRRPQDLLVSVTSGA